MELDRAWGSDVPLLSHDDDNDDVILPRRDHSPLSSATSSNYCDSQPRNVKTEQTTPRDIAALVHEAIKAVVHPAFTRMRITNRSDSTHLANFFPSLFRPGFIKVGMPSVWLICYHILTELFFRKWPLDPASYRVSALR